MTTDTDRREGLLRKVRGLVAKADATPFEGEADVFRAKASELMDKYMIEEWELAHKTGDLSALKPVRKNMDISWWYREEDEIAAPLWSLYLATAAHCSVVCAYSKAEWGSEISDEGLYVTTLTVPVFGTEQAIAFHDMLFTSLMTQMFGKLKPKYDPNLSMGENVAIAKSVGMKYTDIAKWLGHPEWVVPNGSGGWKTADNGKMLREYKKHAASVGENVNKANPKVYIRSYGSGFVGKVNERLRDMRNTPVSDAGNPLALAVRDASKLAREAMEEEFPEDPKKKGKALKVRQRSYDYTAAAKGSRAGAEANIASDAGTLRKSKEIS